MRTRTARLAVVLPFALTLACTKKPSQEAPPAGPTDIPLQSQGKPAIDKTGLAIRGRVFVESAETGQPFRMSADPACDKAHDGKPVPRQEVLVGENGGLANVFIYVKSGLPENVPPPGEESVTLDQRGCIYAPHVLAVRVGQTLRIVNSDPTLHNVNAGSKTSQGFNIGMPTQGQVTEKKFSKPEVMIRFKCDVHGWMSAHVAVVDHPYFAITNEKGEFAIPGLSAGSYTLELWHEKLGTRTAVANLVDGDVKLEAKF